TPLATCLERKKTPNAGNVGERREGRERRPTNQGPFQNGYRRAAWNPPAGIRDVNPGTRQCGTSWNSRPRYRGGDVGGRIGDAIGYFLQSPDDGAVRLAPLRRQWQGQFR